MAVGETSFPGIHPVTGVRIGVISAGIKKPGRKDLVVFEICPTSTIAGVFTQNAFCAAPVHIARQHLQQGDASNPRYLLINTGNANAGTGETGFSNALQTCIALAEKVNQAAVQVLPFSTGVIGEPLPVDRIIAGLDKALTDLSASNWANAAQGIMTTDTRPKGSSLRIEIDGKPVVISGIAKGAGMIKPNMATMLGYVATDMAIPQSELQSLLATVNEKSFNRITVDGDTSTNDSVMLIATGQSGINYANLNKTQQDVLIAALHHVFTDLAQQIIRDGEGATKFVTVKVEKAATSREALQVAYAVAESPLVKTALFASDPNWGRILAAIGRAGLPELDVRAISISLNDVQIVNQGGRAASYTEQSGQAEMDKEEITIAINLQRGNVQETVWTTDLSHDYVTINAEYRT